MNGHGLLQMIKDDTKNSGMGFELVKKQIREEDDDRFPHGIRMTSRSVILKIGDRLKVGQINSST